MAKYTKKQIEDEADKIFIKLNPQFARKDGTFPLAGSAEASPAYNRAYNRVYKQVRRTRLSMNK